MKTKSEEFDKSATLRIVSLLKLLIDEPELHTKKSLASKFVVSLDTIKHYIEIMRMAGFDIKHNGPPNYFYFVSNIDGFNYSDNNNGKTKVYMFSDEQKLIKVFKSISEASKFLNIQYSQVLSAIRNQGFVLKKYYLSLTPEIDVKRKKRELNPLLRGYKTVGEYNWLWVKKDPDRYQKYLEKRKSLNKKNSVDN